MIPGCIVSDEKAAANSGSLVYFDKSKSVDRLKSRANPARLKNVSTLGHFSSKQPRIALIVDDAHCKKCAVRVPLNDRVADPGPPLTKRLLRKGGGHMIVLKEPAPVGVQFNELRSAGAFSLAAHALNQRRRTVAADTLSKILLKGYMAVFSHI